MINNLKAMFLNWGKSQLPVPRDIQQCLDTFLVVRPGVGGLLVLSRLRLGMLLKSCSAEDRPPTTKNYPSSSINSVRVEKPCLTVNKVIAKLLYMKLPKSGDFIQAYSTRC